MRRPLNLAVLTFMLLGLCTQACAQPATSDDEAATSRGERILENLKYRLPQLREASVAIGEITGSDVVGLDQGSITVNGRENYNFLVTTDDTKLYLLAGRPIDVSMSADDIAAAMDGERQEEAVQAAERHAALSAFAAGMPVRGNPDAPVTIFEFSDFQCPYCSSAFATVEQILEKYPNDVNFVYLHLPLDNHPWAKPAAIAAICAAEQSDDAFWTLHDSYFRNQRGINPGNVLNISREFLAVSGSGIDFDVWSDCASNTASEAYQAASTVVDSSVAIGNGYGVEGTPGFFVNGQFLYGAKPLEEFEEVIEGVLEEGGR